MGHRRALSRRLRDRTTAAFQPLLAALMGPMHILWCGPLAPGVCRCARDHAGDLGRARSGGDICSPRT
jgi:hypothetical protein